MVRGGAGAERCCLPTFLLLVAGEGAAAAATGRGATAPGGYAGDLGVPMEVEVESVFLARSWGRTCISMLLSSARGASMEVGGCGYGCCC